ncbi:hypothetical protein HGB07_04700 [Candidatus Roizmanbacteria bacterium]|nr:hypothetical protein [Candidatus Roizmanbacteria bacterium]
MQKRHVISVIDDKPMHECGIVAAVDVKNKKASHLVYLGLQEIQHRGQESTGITNIDFKSVKAMGKVNEVFTREVVESLEPTVSAIGHVRYSTSKSSEAKHIHPFHREITSHGHTYRIALAHNGNVTNTGWIKSQLVNPDEESSDSALVTDYLILKRPLYSSWIETLQHEMGNINGSTNLVILTEDKNIYAIKCKNGIHPLSVGKIHDGGWAVSSESVSFDRMNAYYVREFKPGEIMVLSPEGQRHSYFYGMPNSNKLCTLELGYFARPDTYFADTSAYLMDGRRECGRRLAQLVNAKKIKYDVVIPVMNSGRDAAMGFQEESGRPFRHLLTRRDSIPGRSFITPGQSSREVLVRAKLHALPIPQNMQRVAVVDDSMVRSTTAKTIVKMLRAAGAKEVHMALALDMVVDTCHWGVDMPEHSQLPASQWLKEGRAVVEKEMAKLIGADSVTYLPTTEVHQAFKLNPFYACSRCFGGENPEKMNESKHCHKKKKARQGLPRIAILASTNGTNMANIVQNVNEKRINAVVAGVIISDLKAKALEKATALGLNPIVHEFHGPFKNQEYRKLYDQKLFKLIEQMNVDIIALAGYNLVLSEDFLKKAVEHEIVIINIHPALLTEDKEPTISTSHYTIPVIRGAHGIEKAYAKDLFELPIAGVTVHQVIPHLQSVDCGPIVMKEEVKRIPGETLEELDARVHACEYDLFPAAINHVLQATTNNIDTSQGFEW